MINFLNLMFIPAVSADLRANSLAHVPKQLEAKKNESSWHAKLGTAKNISFCFWMLLFRFSSIPSFFLLDDLTTNSIVNYKNNNNK